jgi:hypothetical protein
MSGYYSSLAVCPNGAVLIVQGAVVLLVSPELSEMARCLLPPAKGAALEIRPKLAEGGKLLGIFRTVNPISNDTEQRFGPNWHTDWYALRSDGAVLELKPVTLDDRSNTLAVDYWGPVFGNWAEALPAGTGHVDTILPQPEHWTSTLIRVDPASLLEEQPAVDVPQAAHTDPDLVGERILVTPDGQLLLETEHELVRVIVSPEDKDLVDSEQRARL